MPSTTSQRSLDRASVSNPYGAGGSPIGETTAPPPRPGKQHLQVGGRLVDDAVDRATLRSMVKRGDGERIPDEVIDQLLAGASTEEEIAGTGRSFGAVDQADQTLLSDREHRAAERAAAQPLASAIMGSDRGDHRGLH